MLYHRGNKDYFEKTNKNLKRMYRNSEEFLDATGFKGNRRYDWRMQLKYFVWDLKRNDPLFAYKKGYFVGWAIIDNNSDYYFSEVGHLRDVIWNELNPPLNLKNTVLYKPLSIPSAGTIKNIDNFQKEILNLVNNAFKKDSVYEDLKNYLYHKESIHSSDLHKNIRSELEDPKLIIKKTIKNDFRRFGENLWFVSYKAGEFDFLECAYDSELEYNAIWYTKSRGGKGRYRNHAKELREGDLCIFWESGGESKGIVGYGFVENEAFDIKIEKKHIKHELKKENRPRTGEEIEVVIISIDRVFPKRILYSDIKDNPNYIDGILGDIETRNFQGSFFPINNNNWKFAKKLFEEANYASEGVEIPRIREEEEEMILSNSSSDPVLNEKPNYSMIQRKVRDPAFSELIKKQYDFRCVICGKRRFDKNSNPEVEAAHIYPRSEDGSNNPKNGIALCKFHHWAFDSGLFTISDDLRIIVWKKVRENSDNEEIYKYENKTIQLPKNQALKPHKIYLEAHRKLHKYE